MSKRGKASRKKAPSLILTSVQSSDGKQTYDMLRTPHSRILEARKILNGSHNPDRFKFREKQLALIQNSVNKILENDKPKKSRILMLTGSPGTGKTLCANFYLRNSAYKVIFMNANSIKSKNDVQNILVNELIPQQKIPENLTTFKAITLLLEAQIPPTILYIEQIQLFFKSSSETNSQDFFDIFYQKNLKIMLLGISNTIDAIQKHGIKMKVRVQDITNIVFNPYSSTEMVSIIEDKLDQVKKKTGINLQFTGNLVKFVVNKLCQVRQSDMRYVFEFLKTLGKLILPQTRTDIDNIQINISEVKKALGELRLQKILLFQSLPTGQQMVVIAIYNHLAKYDEIFLNLDSLKISLREVLGQLNINMVQQRELKQQISQLEDNGFIQLKSKKNTKTKDRIFLKISLDDIKFIYQDHQRYGKLLLY